MKGKILSTENVRDIFGILRKGPLYTPISILQVRDFIGQEKGLENVYHDQGIKKEALTISSLEQAKEVLKYKPIVDFDENLIKPKVLTHDFLGDNLIQANKIRDQLRHVGGSPNPITLDMLKGKTVDDLITACDSHIKAIDKLRGSENLEKVKKLVEGRKSNWEDFNHSSVGKKTDFLEIAGYTHSPSEAKEEIRRLEQMKSDFERAIKQYPRSISLKDSYTRYRMFAEEIIKDLKSGLGQLGFVNDLIDLKAKELDKIDFIQSNEELDKTREEMFQQLNHTENPRVNLVNDTKEKGDVSTTDILERAEAEALEIRKGLRHVDMGEQKDLETKEELDELVDSKIKDLDSKIEELEAEIEDEEKETEIPEDLDMEKSKKEKITKAQKKLVEQIHGKGDFYEADDILYFKPKDKETTFRVDFDETARYKQ